MFNKFCYYPLDQIGVLAGDFNIPKEYTQDYNSEWWIYGDGRSYIECGFAGGGKGNSIYLGGNTMNYNDLFSYPLWDQDA